LADPLKKRHRTTTFLPRSPWACRGLSALCAAQFLLTLYCFLLSITLVGTAFAAFGEDFARGLITSTENPFVGLFIGILATSIVQSSSATTSIVVGLVAMKPEMLPNAIPIIMGANIGTTVTCSLVSLGHITRKEEFRRAMAGALVHDFFNLIAVAILLPLELTTHYLQKAATGMGELLWKHAAQNGEGGFHGFRSPLKAILKPVAELIVGLFKGGDTGRLSAVGGVLVLMVALAGMFGSLWFMTRLMRGALVGRAEPLMDKTIGRAPLLGLVVGAVLTAIVQSSSAVTSILVPLAGAGVLRLEQLFPITLGANVGTTVTALLAALAAGPAGLKIALVHMLFNVSGIVLIYPLPPLRRIPIRLAQGMADLAAESKIYALAFVVGTFFVVPGVLIALARLF
jgi:sodium-dependent phosphate cotransporter